MPSPLKAVSQRSLVLTASIVASCSPSRLLPMLLAATCLLPAAALQAQQGVPEFLGPAGCVDCHTAPSPLRYRDLALLDESPIWLDQDKHAKAFVLLKGELGTSMAKRLGIADVLKEKRCLSCHANWHSDSKTPPPFFDLGVTCESCHGPSSKWLAPHYDILWRAMTAEKKQELGMVDVRSPIARARQCFSCHIGKADEGKVLTHDMYAAGHPPLPGIELESFAEQMPPHWRNLRERSAFESRKEFLAANYPGPADVALADLPRTKGVVVGGVVALQVSVRLFGSQAAVEKGSPELAVFDCNACHHDLRSPSWRQERGYYGVAPGRPSFTAWPTALMKLGLRHEAGDDDAKFAEQTEALEARLKTLREAVAARPFGDAGKVRVAVADLDKWLEALVVKLSKSPFDEAAARRSLATLGDLPANEFPDFHSARQIAWAIKVIYVELNTKYPTFAPSPVGAEEREERKVRRAREDKDAADFLAWRAGPRAQTQAKVNELFDKHELNDKLFLKLPAGQEYKIEAELPGSLKRMTDYDARWFRTQLDALKKELSPQ